MPYCLPFNCQAWAAEPTWPIQPELSLVRSATLPDGIWVANWPPPHCW